MTLLGKLKPSSTRVRTGGGLALAGLAATTMLVQGDQSALAQAVHGLEQQFGLSDQVVGLIPLVMAAAGALGAIPLGMLADRRRRTWVLAGVALVWTLAMGVGAGATTFVVLITSRLVTGAAEGTPPVAISLLSDYFPVRRRSEAMGVYQAGAIVGAFIGLLGGGIAVDIGGPVNGWRWAFYLWVPIGVLVAIWFVFLLREPMRGHQDAGFEAELGQAAPLAEAAEKNEPATAMAAPDVACLATGGMLALPAPRKGPPPPAGHIGQREALRHLMRIPSMWFGTLSLTVSQLLLYGLSFWGVTYFERVHHLGPALAGLLSTVLGAGSAIGILAGGFLSDRLLRRGHVNARVYVVAYGAIAATLVLAPAFAIGNLWLGAPLIFIGGIMLTLPIAPAEALCTDVVPPELRGRGAMVRQVVRTGSYAGPYLIGVISVAITSHSASSSVGLHWAIVAVCPLYALGGLIMLAAVRHYPRDIAYVVANARAKLNGKLNQNPVPDLEPVPDSGPDPDAPTPT
ncbi:MAG TPA: MFS transporter [Streptosporangiaceae bacterium]|jgi:MFS family permease|nr:MFS transporter [Streptosporangiaceae bacterium]